ncbi:MAG TPA: SNF2-related protein [Sediminibacterium sp.]|uniref:SNF2-related protein n=1 Tax=Sediminibacterium sp. TaxID=1917865 RepID=UPI0026BA671A|nr:SNF2-related protein [Sediminibacterium sp.]HLD52746.1 SNF2-related protein [Sediminibacterium sp.]
MLLDKISIFNKTKLNIAKAIAPIKQTSVISFKQVEFEISQPKRNTAIDFQIPKVKISANYTIPTTTYRFYQAVILPLAKIGESAITELLSATLINYNVLSNLTIPQIINVQISSLFEPKVFDCIEYNKLFTLDIKIENIHLSFVKPTIKGKNYTRKIETIQANLFSGTDEEYNTITRTSKPKIERYYTEKNKHDKFEIFDLIFPALQPPLGNSFDNPISFPYQLYPFQVDGVKFLHSSTTALLGDEMGLGKSIQTITAARFLYREGKISSACIICPKAVMSDWEKKLWDWAPELKVIKIEGSKVAREILWNSQTHFYICTYETLLRDFENTSEIRGLEINERGHLIKCPNTACGKNVTSPYSFHYNASVCPHCKHSIIHPNNGDIAKTNFDLLIIDEIQKTKNPHAKITKALRTLYAKYKWALTGTPLENKVEDLVSICETIKPKIFDNVYIGDIAKVIETYKPIFKRRKKEDVLKELPSKSTKEVWLDLLPTQREKYDLAEQQGIVDLEDRGETVTVQHVLALITKLKQICNYEITTDESVKLEYLKEELEELTEQGDKALVFSQYPNETLKRIFPHLKEYSPNIYDGSLSDLKRTTIVNDFQTTENSKVMLLSLKAGNAGITLTRANYVYHFDLWWNPAVSAQAVDRAHRIGQTKTVFERLLLAEDTIERRIYNILADKRRLFNEVVNGLNDANVLSQTMTEDEIFGLFGLKKNRLQPKQRIENKSKDFNSLDPFEFEVFIGELFSQMGYNSRVTKKSNDGGIDIFAKLHTPMGIDEVIIQCKHKVNPSSTVDVAKVRELFGVFSANKKLTKAILVTNGRFTSGAIEFAKDNRIELIDGTKLQGYVELHYL